MTSKLVLDPTYTSRVIFGKEDYGRLKLVGVAGYFLEGTRQKKRAAFNFKCECGNVVVLRGKDVKSGKIESCGCLGLETKQKTGLANRLPNCSGLKNLLFYRHVAGAKKRHIPTELTQEQFEQFLFKDCHYCGSGPSNEFKHNLYCKLKYNGIDRVDSNKTYSINNCVPCCKTCNWAKNKQTYEEFQQ